MSGDAVEHERKALSMMSKKRFTEINDRVSQILKDAGASATKKSYPCNRDAKLQL